MICGEFGVPISPFHVVQILTYASFEEAASSNCDALIARALAIAPNDHEALMTLASIRMSQSKFDEAKAVTLKVYSDLEGRDPC